MAYYGPDKKELKVYGNPMQPEFGATAWAGAPRRDDGVLIWVTHTPPLGRLDRTKVEGLSGCRALARNIEEARPRLCVFGHFHYGWGAERVVWAEGVEMLTLSGERKREEDGV